jgi:RNA repair, ligase-Pnkp-associating, region of Hen1
MLLTITNTKSPATDLGYLLHKNPSRVQSFDLSFGKAHVFYPEASADCCTAALLLDVDPVGLVRTRRGPCVRLVAQETFAEKCKASRAPFENQPMPEQFKIPDAPKTARQASCFTSFEKASTMLDVARKCEIPEQHTPEAAIGTLLIPVPAAAAPSL